MAILGDAVDAEPEGEARPLLGVEAARREHVRVDHAAAAQLDPPPSGVDMSNSADGSVNGKYDGRRRVVRSSPNSAFTNASMVPARSANVMSRSTTRPSIWWNTGRCVASAVSWRNIWPGATT